MVRGIGIRRRVPCGNDEENRENKNCETKIFKNEKCKEERHEEILEERNNEHPSPGFNIVEFTQLIEATKEQVWAQRKENNPLPPPHTKDASIQNMIKLREEMDRLRETQGALPPPLISRRKYKKSS